MTEPDRQHGWKFGEVQPCGFRGMRADRQTDRQERHTHHNTSHPPGGGGKQPVTYDWLSYWLTPSSASLNTVRFRDNYYTASYRRQQLDLLYVQRLVTVETGVKRKCGSRRTVTIILTPGARRRQKRVRWSIAELHATSHARVHRWRSPHPASWSSCCCIQHTARTHAEYCEETF